MKLLYIPYTKTKSGLISDENKIGSENDIFPLPSVIPIQQEFLTYHRKVLRLTY